jgi:Uma2 family endonuclease
MLSPKPVQMTFEEYHAWEQEQDELWELVNGVPVLRSDRWDRDPITGMSGTTRAHNRIVANILRHAGNRLAGGSCTALASHLKHRSSVKSARYPDASIECDSTDMQSLVAENTRVIFEVLSKSNTPAQQMLLLADYQAIKGLAHMVFVEQQRPAVIFWTRNADGWRAEEVFGFDAVLPLTAVQIELPLAEIYEGLTFDA